MINYIILAFSVIILGAYLWDLKKIKFSTRNITTIAMFSAVGFILYMVQIVKYPQGGGITLFSMLPIVMLAVLGNRQMAITCAILVGALKVLNGGFVVHPAQFMLDYILASMAVGLAGIFGTDKKINILGGAFFAMMLSTFICVISGVVYFAQYAPKGMNVWWYSIVYNYSSQGLEGVLTVILMAFLPINMLKRVVGKQIA